MTMQMPTMPTRTVELPPPGYPMLTRMISNALFPETSTQPQVMGCPHCKANISVPMPDKTKEDPIAWIVGQPHPLVKELKVMRMFVAEDGSVEVYSVTSDGKAGMRNVVPAATIRLIEEAMPIEVFVDEMAQAEEDNASGPDPEPEPEPDTDQTTSSPVATANGQPS